MKLLLVSDVHLDTAFAWAGPQVARHRRRALRTAFQRACEQADANDVDALVVAGDLYEHDRFSPDTAEFLRTCLADLGRPVFLAPGNHDWYGPSSLYAQVDWSPNVTVFTEPRLVAAELTDGFTLWGAAHCAPAGTPGFLDDFSVDRGGVHAGLFHGSESGAFGWEESGKQPHAPFGAEQVPAAGLHHALVGHYHRPSDSTWFTYPGNPDPLAFGETGERAAVLVEFDASGGVTRTRIPVAVTQVHDVTVDLTGVSNATEMRERVVAGIAGLSGVVRATLEGEIGRDADVQIADLAGVGEHLDAFVPKLGRITVAYDLEGLAVENTVRGQFVRDVQAAELDDDTRRRVLITGLRALDGRADDLDVI